MRIVLSLDRADEYVADFLPRDSPLHIHHLSHLFESALGAIDDLNDSFIDSLLNVTRMLRVCLRHAAII